MAFTNLPVTAEVGLDADVHSIRLSNAAAPMPDVDVMVLR